MRQRRLRLVTLAAVVMAAAGSTALVAARSPQAPDLGALVLPDGFHISVYAEGVTGARQMALSPSGTIFVGSRQPGLVHAVIDRNGDFTADEVKVVARGLRQPNGVALRDGALFVATPTQLLRFDDIEQHLDAPPTPVVLRDDLPFEDNNHSWKFIAFGPDGKLYIPFGAPCNICEPDDPFASISRMNADGTGMEIVARGVRNTVGFDWHPATGHLWFTDNGRDLLGDDIPSDELNVVTGGGMHFGYPYCHQGDFADPEFGATRPCSDFTPPAQKMGPHVAAIGMTFYTGSMFPASYRNAAIIAQHGSWNRSKPIGYRVMVARTDGDRVTGYEPLVDGFLPGVRYNVDGQHTGAAAIGRPSDILQLPDGSILISDDTGNRIFRVTYGG